MFELLHKTIKDKELSRLDSFRPGSWIHAEKPDENELKKLSEEFSLDLGLLRDAVDPFEVPRLEIDGGIIYIFTRVPEKEEGRIITEPLLVAIAPEFLLTVSREPLPFLQKFFENKVSFTTTQKTKLLLQIFSEITGVYNSFLASINRDVRGMGVNLEKIENKDIIQFVAFEGVLNDFLGALNPTSASLNKLLSAGKSLNLYEEDKDLIEDLFLGTGQLVELCRSTLKTIVNIREAYSTIMTNNLNRIIKLFTALTIIMTIPMIISSFFGMNVALPFADSPLAFSGIFFGTMLVSLGLVFLFLKKRWL